MAVKAGIYPLTQVEKKHHFGDPTGGIEPSPGVSKFRPTDMFKARLITRTVSIPGPFVSEVPVCMHEKVLPHFESFIADVASAGLGDRIVTFDGSIAFRRVRGGHTLSSHAFGIAFDINAVFNPMGTTPLAHWEHGSVSELVPIALKHGFFWGGWFHSRPDGMHFEYGLKAS
jgi:hypothetical protein